MHLAPQHDQLLPERSILRLKPALRLEECGQQVQGQEDQPDHRRQPEAILSPVQRGEVFGTHRIPLAFGTLVFIVMVTWHFGFEAMRQRHTVLTETPEEFFRLLKKSAVPRVPGTAIFLTRLATTTPFLIVEHVAQMKAMYETAVALTVQFENIPRVAPRDRIELVKLAEGFWHVIVHFGFVQIPDIPAALRQAKDRGCPINLEDAIYFGSRDAVVCSKRRSWLVRVRLRLFALMFRNSVRTVDLFNIPPENFVEVGRQIEI